MSGGEPPFTQPPASGGRSAIPRGTGPASPATLIRWWDEAIPGTEDARHMGMGIAEKGREPAWFQNLTLEEKEETAELLEGGEVAVGQGLRVAVMESGVEGV